MATALARLSAVDEVEGRFARTMRNGRPVRLLLAKNPAGWTAIFDLLEEDGRGDVPVVLSINARIADGLDTSWLWDVPFERLAGRPVVATGDRRLDLAVRLRYAEVACTVVAGSAGRRRPGHGRRARRPPPCAPGPDLSEPSPSTSSATTRPSPSSGAVCDAGPECGAGHRRGLPRSAGHLRRRRERAGPGPPGRRGGASTPSSSRPTPARPLPTADIYCIGGGEDGPEVRSAEALRADGTLARAVGHGAVVLGVCAGYQLLGRTFPDSADRPHEGLGLLDVTTRKGTGARAVGEVVATPAADAPRLAGGQPPAHRSPASRTTAR